MNGSRRSQAKRKKILAAGQALFSKKGFRQTTLHAIARRAKMGKASLYYYFPEGKESIFAAVVEGLAAKAFTDIMVKLEAAKTPRDKLEAYLRARIENFHDHMQRHQLTGSTKEELMPIAAAEVKKYFIQELEILEYLIQAGKEADQFTTENPAVAARIIQASVKGLTMDRPLQTEKQVWEIELNEFLWLTLAGLEAKRPE